VDWDFREFSGAAGVLGVVGVLGRLACWLNTLFVAKGLVYGVFYTNFFCK